MDKLREILTGEITVVSLSFGSDWITINKVPDECPVCRAHILPEHHWYGRIGGRYGADLEIVFGCPNQKCVELFIGYYSLQPSTGNFLFMCTRPNEPVPLMFEEPLSAISPQYCLIFEEAHKAEAAGLTQICGMGYRKALEFLIKDYLIASRPDDKAKIEKDMLGKCIEIYVTDGKLKAVAKRAVWLGNDETHYQRRWDGKDVSDLKLMIRLTVHWIESEYRLRRLCSRCPKVARVLIGSHRKSLPKIAIEFPSGATRPKPYSNTVH